MRSLARTLRAIGSFVALVAIVVGLPFALVTWGHWPINGLPTWRQVENLPSTIVTDTALFGILTVAVWVVWAAFCTSVAVELVGNVRGEPGVELPLCGPVQRWARPLVASLVMSVSATGSVASAAVGGAVAARPAAVVVEPDQSPLQAFVAARRDSPRSAVPTASRSDAPGERTVHVREDDTFWEIAERVLGDGLRWREIRDLNAGRVMPDGRVIGPGTEMLVPGWALILPDEPAPPEAQAADAVGAAGRAAPPDVEVRSGDNIWRIAEDHLATTLGRTPADGEVAEYCRTVIEHNRERFVDPGNPDLIYPGQTFALPLMDTAKPTPPDAGEATGSEHEPEPAAPAESSPAPPDAPSPRNPSPAATAPPIPDAPATATTSPADTPMPPTSLPSPSSVPDSATDSGQEEPSSPALPIVAGTGTALAVGIIAAIRRRRRQRNYLHPKTVPPPSSDQDLHRELIVSADEEAIDRLAVALDHLARGLADADQVCRPLIIQHGPDHTDVLLDSPATAVIDGWDLVDDGSLLTLDTATTSDDAPHRWSSPAPLLVSLGRPDGDGQIYLDLEAAGVTTLVGDPVVRLDMMRSFAAEVAHSPLTETTQVYVVGRLGGELLLGECEQVIVVDSWDKVLGSLAAWTAQSRAALSSAGCPNGFVARTDDPDDDALVSLVVFATGPPPLPDSLDFMHASPATTAVVVADDNPLDGSTVVDCAPEEVRLPQLGLSCVPAALDEERAERIAGLLTDASDPVGTQLALAFDPEADLGGNGAKPDEEGSSGDADAATPYEDPQYEVLVRFLGDVSVEGDLRRRLTAQELSAVSFIALKGPVTVDRVEDALWAAPTKVGTRRRLISIVSRCRAAIGDDRIPKAGDRYYRVDPLVQTDIDLFEARVAAASRKARREDAADLRLSALGLCTGEVFHTKAEDSNSFAWIEASNLVSHWEIRITDLAEEVANDCLAHGDVRRAVEACEAGLRAMQTHTGCTEALMRAHAHNGHREAVQHVFQAHVTALERIHLDQVAESTAALYNQLMATP